MIDLDKRQAVRGEVTEPRSSAMFVPDVAKLVRHVHQAESREPLPILHSQRNAVNDPAAVEHGIGAAEPLVNVTHNAANGIAMIKSAITAWAM